MVGIIDCIIVGYVGQDLKRFIPDDGSPPWGTFSVGVTVRKEAPTIWFNVSVNAKNYEFCDQYLKKGMMVLVKGPVNAKAYMSKEEKPQASLQIVGFQITILNWKDQNAQVPGESDSGDTLPGIENEASVPRESGDDENFL